MLTVLKDVENEVRRSRALSYRFPWFDTEEFGAERDAATLRLTVVEKAALASAESVLRGYVLAEVDRYTTGGRHPPSPTDWMVSNELVREIYEALERNGDITRTWAAAKHTTFARVFGARPG